MTAAQVENIIMTYAQAGEHIRIDSTHSISFLAYTTDGFYYMDYATDSDPKIYIRYTTWQQFASQCNSYGKWACIYDVDRSTNDISTSVSIVTYPDYTTIQDTNAELWGKVNKPSSYAVTKIGIKVRKDGSSYSNGWSKYEAPSKDYVGETYMHPYYNLNNELNLTLTHATKYYYQFYAVVNGNEYWSDEFSFTTTGSHSYPSNWTTVTDAKCTSSGTAKRVCSSCGKTETKVLASLGHNYSSEWTIDKEATCTEAGAKSYHCTRCDTRSSITEIPATGEHSYKYGWLESPTENRDGIFSKICDRCNESHNYNIPLMKIENVIFADNKIECRILNPNIDSELSFFIAAMYDIDGEGQKTTLSKDEEYDIFVLESESLIKGNSVINIQLWFGAGEIPYNISVLENLEYSFEEICKDVNGDAQHNSLDLTLLRKKLINTTEIRTGDTNADGTVNLKDLVSLKKYLIA